MHFPWILYTRHLYLVIKKRASAKYLYTMYVYATEVKSLTIYKRLKLIQKKSYNKNTV